MKAKDNDGGVQGGGVLLLAKQPGRTSFASLASVKKALGTGKVGHTGTLDSFADGLLVVLTGRLTRLVPHITNFDKTYRALIKFGEETDTLDPTGTVTRTGRLPSEAEVRAVLPQFVGAIAQVPPQYSALHVGGKRASDLARQGREAALPARTVTIHAIELLDFAPAPGGTAAYALVSVRCSKGTYIRALARDIAAACGTCAHLAALRRTAVGPFTLDAAVGAGALGEFTMPALLARQLAPGGAPHAGAESAGSSESSAGGNAMRESCADSAEAGAAQEFGAAVKSTGNGETDGHCVPGAGIESAESRGNAVRPAVVDEAALSAIRAGLLPMNRALAARCGLFPAVLSPYFVEQYRNGRPLQADWFVQDAARARLPAGDIAAFYPKGRFAGVVRNAGGALSYAFVVPPPPKPAVYTWDDIASGRFGAEFRAAGTALTIGSFDGPHLGHDALFDAVLAQRARGLAPGVVTFTRSLRGYKNPDDYAGDVATLCQRLGTFAAKGFAFAIVIDFSAEFGRIEGTEFLKVLIDSCRMRYLAEGRDFRCGYKGSADMGVIGAFGAEHGFELCTIDAVRYGGERVSSSRIRGCIASGDFGAASYMLERPFALDCSGFAWTEAADGARRVLSARGTGAQVLPPDGSYRVLAILSHGQKSGEAQSSVRVRAYRSDCTLENGNLRLSVPGTLIGGCVRAIQFGCPDENKL